MKSLYQKVLSMPKKDLANVIAACGSISQTVRHLGFKGQDPRVRKYLLCVVDELDLHKAIERHKRNRYTVNQVRAAVKRSLCFSDVLGHLGLQAAGGNINTIKRFVKRYNIDTSHFDIGKARARGKRRWSYNDIFRTKSKCSRSRLKEAVLKYKVLTYECALCDNGGIWCDKPLVLALDHINGVNSDNRVSNLRFVCPNCHSQTTTYAGRNRNAGVPKRPTGPDL